MHSDEINPDVQIEEPVADIDDDFGHRPVLLEGFTPVDGSNVIVPVDRQGPESYILALTEEQGIQVLLVVAAQVGNDTAYNLIGTQLDHDRMPK